jgi:Tat protein secretion system quality control protein TatD with DNase activity
VPWVAKALAELKSCDVQTIADTTNANFDSLFERRPI